MKIEFTESIEERNKNILHLKYALGLVEWSMRFTGLWPMRNRFSNLQFTMCAISLCGISASCLLGMSNSKNLELLIESLLYFIITLATLAKLIIVKYNSKNMRIILRNIASDCSQYSYLPSRTRESITNNIKERKLVTLTTTVFLSLSLAAYIMQTHDTNSQDMSMIKKLPFLVIFPKLIVFLFLIIVGGFSFFISTIVVVTVDSIFATLMVHATNQFTIVSDKLKMYDDERYYTCISERNYLHYCKCIKCIAKQHIATLRFVKQIENTFEVLLLIEITRNILHFGIQMYNFIWFYKISSIIKLAHVAIILFSMNLHLVLYCVFAKKMTSATIKKEDSVASVINSISSREGEEIGISASKLKWYNFRVNTIKNITLIIQQSQKPCVVTAGRFVNMSLETYTFVMKTAISYASFILTIRARS